MTAVPLLLALAAAARRRADRHAGEHPHDRPESLLDRLAHTRLGWGHLGRRCRCLWCTHR